VFLFAAIAPLVPLKSSQIHKLFASCLTSAQALIAISVFISSFLPEKKTISKTISCPWHYLIYVGFILAFASSFHNKQYVIFGDRQTK
jgi:hypothetical protein